MRRMGEDSLSDESGLGMSRLVACFFEGVAGTESTLEPEEKKQRRQNK